MWRVRLTREELRAEYGEKMGTDHWPFKQDPTDPRADLSIDDIRAEYKELGSMATNLSGPSRIWANAYFTRVSRLLAEIDRLERLFFTY